MTDPERTGLADIGRRLDRKALEVVVGVLKSGDEMEISAELIQFRIQEGVPLGLTFPNRFLKERPVGSLARLNLNVLPDNLRTSRH